MWFTETPWPPFLICLVLAAIFFGQWMQKGTRGSLWAWIACLTLGGLIVVVESLIVTETERVEAAIEGLTKAFRAGDADGCDAFFSAQDPQDRQLVRQAAGMVKVESAIRITDMSIAMTSAQSRAVARFRANADVEFQGHRDRARTHLELTWQREGNEWKIVRLRRLSLLGEDEIQPLSRE